MRHPFSLIPLRHKILVGLMLSMIPVFVIAGIAYFALRTSTIDDSQRIMRILNQHRARELNYLLSSHQKIVDDWSVEDVFGLALEFQTFSELNNHLESMLRDHQSFQQVMVTDLKGEVYASAATHDSPQNLGKTSLQPDHFRALTTPMGGADIMITLFDDPAGLTIGGDTNHTLVYVLKISDTQRRHNGFLFVFLSWKEIQFYVAGLASELQRNGFETAQTAVTDFSTGEILAHSQKAFINSRLNLPESAKRWFTRKTEDEIGRCEIDGRSVFIAAETLQPVSGNLPGAERVIYIGPELSLVTVVPEQIVMADVRRLLHAALFIGAGGGLTVLLIAFLFMVDIKSKFNQFLGAFEAMSKGDIQDKLAISGRDEFANAATSFNQLVEYLQKVLKVCEGVALGDYDQTIEKSSPDDMLSEAISRMTATLKEMTTRQKEQNWFKTGQAELNDHLRGEQNVNALARHTISFLAEYLDAQVGAIYLTTEDNLLQLKGTYAMTRRKQLGNQFTLGQGLVGQAALEQKEIMVRQLPEDYLTVKSGTGNADPASLLVMPFFYEKEVKGVIELGTFGQFSEQQIDFLKSASESIGITFNTAQARNRMAELLTQTQNQAAAMQEQQEELRASNEELEEQTKLLRESEERLQVQQEELRQTNEELVAKGQLLEKQKADIERKNEDLKKAQQTIEQKARDLELTSKYKSEFLANMSHELRTPLNSLLILSDLLQKNEEGRLSEKEVNFARTINGAASELLHLINEILDLSKIEAGKMSTHIESFALEDFKYDIVHSFEPVAAKKGLAFDVEITPQVPATIRSDRQRLSQIIKNLLSNALKFTDQGSVRLTIDRPNNDADLSLPPDRSIAFHVTDTGKGIAKEKQKLIFEAFQQEDGSTSRKYEGTGLGLSISRELTRLLGGEIRLSSDEGCGSTFSLYLPESPPENDQPGPTASSGNFTAKKAAAQGKVDPAPNAVPAAESADKHAIRDDRHYLTSSDRLLLVIEDDPRFARILLDLSREHGFKCLLAEDGESGLYLVEHYGPDAVLLDLVLPGISGWEVLKRLKNNLDTRHIPVHCISASDASPEALQMGAIGYLVKPAEMQDLEIVFEKFEQMAAQEIHRLLVVEDDDGQRNALFELLTDKGVVVETAENGRRAFDLLKKASFDCMILDLGLPDMSGLELFQKIEADEAIGYIPTIVFTGRELSQEEEAELARFAQSIILKGTEKSQARLLDESSLFLHRVAKDMPDEKRRVIETVHKRQSVLENKQILLVDDDMRNVFALTQVLESRHMQVLAAKNGDEALKQLDRNPDIDLVLMDIMMPVMDGYEAMQAIREQDRFAKLPIIALTAKAMRGDRRKCIDAGANDYLSKPVDTHRLLSLLKVWLYR